MKLAVIERAHLLNLLPTEGKFDMLRTVRETKEKLAFDDDAEELALKPLEDGRWQCADWSREKEISLSPKAIMLITKALTDMEEKGKLPDKYFTLYQKFVEGAGEPAPPLPKGDEA